MTCTTLTAATMALSVLVAPALADDSRVKSIEFGNVWFTDPMLSLNYAQSQDDPAEFALAVTTPDPVKSKNGLAQSTAVLVNCKSGKYSASFGYHPEKSFEDDAELIAVKFCNIHKKSFSHSLW